MHIISMLSIICRGLFGAVAASTLKMVISSLPPREAAIRKSPGMRSYERVTVRQYIRGLSTRSDFRPTIDRRALSLKSKLRQNTWSTVRTLS